MTASQSPGPEVQQTRSTVSVVAVPGRLARSGGERRGRHEREAVLGRRERAWVALGLRVSVSVFQWGGYGEDL